MLAGRAVLVKGGGDFASGTIRRLHLLGLAVVATELAEPMCVRREVCFATAVDRGQITVEGVTGQLCSPGDIERVQADKKVPVIVDPEAAILAQRAFHAVVDGRLAKRNLGTRLTEAPAVIGLGPGFEAGRDCHAVIETYMGHDLGRPLWSGAARPDTGCAGPGEYGVNQNWDRIVLRAPQDGIFRRRRRIGQVLDASLREPDNAVWSVAARSHFGSPLFVCEWLRIGLL